MDNSIHPRNWPGTGNRIKKNTSYPPRLETRQRLIAALSEHLGRHPRDKMTRARLDRLGPVR